MFRIPLLHILHNTYSVKFLGKRVLKTKKYIFYLYLKCRHTTSFLVNVHTRKKPSG